MKSVVLYGAGSPVIVDAQETCRRAGLVVAAVVKNFDGEVFSMAPDPVIDKADLTAELLQLSFTIPLFTPAHRKFAHEQAQACGASRFDPLIDPTAVLPGSLLLGDGVYINSGASIGGMSKLGAFTFVNRAATLGHHFVAESYASIGPGAVAAGGVTVGRGAVIGAGAVLFPGVCVGANAVVSAGSVVTRNVPACVIVAGNPAKVVKENIAGYQGKGV